VDLDQRLRTFEPVDLAAASSDAAVDTAFADQFLKVFARMAKAQFKTEQKASLSARKVAEHLDAHSDVLDDLKRQRADLEDRHEQLQRFVLDVVDLITGFGRTAEASGDAEMQATAATMQRSLDTSMQKVGLRPIPALGEVPDAVYHFVLDARAPERAAERGHIVEVVQPGYTLHGEVLRKANVIVAR
jgi:molecular chaperone GrpE